jgi:hypothetical protein
MKITGFFEPPPQPPPAQPAPRPLTKEEKEWDRYFGFDGTCLEHDLHSCGICKRLATGRCFSSLEE